MIVLIGNKVIAFFHVRMVYVSLKHCMCQEMKCDERLGLQI